MVQRVRRASELVHMFNGLFAIRPPLVRDSTHHDWMLFHVVGLLRKRWSAFEEGFLLVLLEVLRKRQSRKKSWYSRVEVRYCPNKRGHDYSHIFFWYSQSRLHLYFHSSILRITINIINIGYIKPDIQAKAYIERVLLPSITNEAGAPKLAIGLLAASAVLPDTQKSLHLSRVFFPDRFSEFFAVSHPSNRKFREIFHLSCWNSYNWNVLTLKILNNVSGIKRALFNICERLEKNLISQNSLAFDKLRFFCSSFIHICR